MMRFLLFKQRNTWGGGGLAFNGAAFDRCNFSLWICTRGSCRWVIFTTLHNNDVSIGVQNNLLPPHGLIRQCCAFSVNILPGALKGLLSKVTLVEEPLHCNDSFFLLTSTQSQSYPPSSPSTSCTQVDVDCPKERQILNRKMICP